MPIDQNHRALLRAVDSLTTQVRRIADTLEPPVVVADLGGQTTGDDTSPLILRTVSRWEPVHDTSAAPAMPYKMCSASTEGASADEARGRPVGPRVLRYRHDGPVHQAADGAVWQQHMVNDVAPDWQHVNATMRENEQLRTELDRIRRALDPDDETYIRETVDDQLALTAKVAGLEAAIERVRAIKPSPPRSESNARTNAQDEGWDQALAAVRAALIGPTMEG